MVPTTNIEVFKRQQERGISPSNLGLVLRETLDWVDDLHNRLLDRLDGPAPELKPEWTISALSARATAVPGQPVAHRKIFAEQTREWGTYLARLAGDAELEDQVAKMRHDLNARDAVSPNGCVPATVNALLWVLGRIEGILLIDIVEGGSDAA